MRDSDHILPPDFMADEADQIEFCQNAMKAITLVLSKMHRGEPEKALENLHLLYREGKKLLGEPMPTGGPVSLQEALKRSIDIAGPRRPIAGVRPVPAKWRH